MCQNKLIYLFSFIFIVFISSECTKSPDNYNVNNEKLLQSIDNLSSLKDNPLINKTYYKYRNLIKMKLDSINSNGIYLLIADVSTNASYRDSIYLINLPNDENSVMESIEKKVSVYDNVYYDEDFIPRYCDLVIKSVIISKKNLSYVICSEVKVNYSGEIDKKLFGHPDQRILLDSLNK